MFAYKTCTQGEQPNFKLSEEHYQQIGMLCTACTCLFYLCFTRILIPPFFVF